MNMTTNHFVRRALFSSMLVAGMLTAVAQPAAAHKYEVRPIVLSHHYYRRNSPVVFPRWLRKNRDFQRWFVRSNYCCKGRFIRGANWDRLYEIYVFEKHYQRRAANDFVAGCTLT